MGVIQYNKPGFAPRQDARLWGRGDGLSRRLLTDNEARQRQFHTRIILWHADLLRCLACLKKPA